jgi:GT2 family glycosyltransferase
MPGPCASTAPRASTVTAGAPRIRVAILNFNGGELVVRAVESVLRTDWPSEALELAIVDNASTDGSPDVLRERFPGARVIDAGENLGFAGGNNLALRDLDGVDYVALLNNDATVEPGWLAPLVEALETDPGLGAACPRILFEPRFLEVSLESPEFVPGRGDPRRLGVRVSGVRVDAEDRWRETLFGEGFHGEEHGLGEETVFRWSGPAGTLCVPAGDHVELRLAAERDKAATARSGNLVQELAVGPEPRWLDVAAAGDPVDVIQNAGSVLVAGGYAGDRGFMEVDRGQYDEPAEVFAWCGCCVLLRPRYLADAGLLDERLFLYYEDIDLSWRGRARGWRYRYVPDSRIRHRHSATSVEGSELFQYYVERNRLLVHLKNAPAGYALRALADWAAPTVRFAVRDAISPLLHGRRPHGRLVRRRLRALGGVLRLAPTVLAERRGPHTPAGELERWVTRR